MACFASVFIIIRLKIKRLEQKEGEGFPCSMKKKMEGFFFPPVSMSWEGRAGGGGGWTFLSYCRLGRGKLPATSPQPLYLLFIFFTVKHEMHGGGRSLFGCEQAFIPGERTESVQSRGEDSPLTGGSEQKFVEFLAEEPLQSHRTGENNKKWRFSQLKDGDSERNKVKSDLLALRNEKVGLNRLPFSTLSRRPSENCEGL